jgi:large subunit ribosomal protein L4
MRQKVNGEDGMKVSVLNMAGNKVGEVELVSSIFEARVSRDLMHQALVRQLANARRGTHNSKTRGEISRTTAKWYRQKGTGRARHGNRRAPIFVGGGVAHGPKPRHYKKAMPRKMRQAAIRSALSAKASTGDIVVLDSLQLDQPKTKEMVNVISNVAGQASTLVLLADRDEYVEMSSRNLANSKTLQANYLNIRDILGYEKIIMPIPALEVVQGNLGLGEGVPMVTEYATVEVAEEEEE